MNNPADAMAVYQLKEDAPVELLFTGLERLDSPPDKANYTAVYTRDLVPDDDRTRILENFYYIFNDDRPVDFTGHSLSISDILALKQDGVVSYYYCDSIGFKELPDFGKDKLDKAAEKKPSVLEKLKEQSEKPKKAKAPKKTKGQEL